MPASFLMSIAGFGLLCMSMHRHARQAGIQDRSARFLRVAGWCALIISLAVGLIAGNWRLMIVEWIGQAGLAAAAVVVILLYRPRILPGAVVVAAIGALLAMAI
jgi:hypothetical protein